MTEDLPTSYDLIVVGTGLSESIVAAAAARIGKQVLHIDHRDYYGSTWGSFSFSSMQDFILSKDKPTHASKDGALCLNYSVDTIINVDEHWFVPDDVLRVEITECEQPVPASMNILPSVEPLTNSFPPEELPSETTVKESLNVSPLQREAVWTKKEILKNSRKFNLDLSPKVLYSRGEMVDLLITSGICRYAEFRNVANVCTYDVSSSRIIPVPCSRADVFSSKELSMIEKRLLMKTLSLCADYEKNPEAFEEFQSRTFGDFLNSKQIRGKVRQYVMDTVAMATESTSFQQGVESVQKFIHSIGRYGNTPFLWTLYGSGELPQCFCRLCAVFGGVYCLKRITQRVLFDESHKAMGILSENQTLKAPLVLVEDSLRPNLKVKGGISRAILITDKSLIDGDAVMLLNFPSIDGKNQVRVLELPPSSMACPRGLYVVHLMTPQVGTATEDLQQVISLLFSSSDGESRPKILWSLHFNLLEFDGEDDIASSVYYAAGPNGELDFDSYVVQAKRTFTSMFPDEEFLPKVPDPEDVILEDTPASDAINEENCSEQKATNANEIESTQSETEESNEGEPSNTE